jgi:hypothetical protein
MKQTSEVSQDLTRRKIATVEFYGESGTQYTWNGGAELEAWSGDPGDMPVPVFLKPDLGLTDITLDQVLSVVATLERTGGA